MISILAEFAYSNVCPQAQYFTKDSEYSRAMELVTRNEEKLLSRLVAENKEQFEKYTYKGKSTGYRHPKLFVWLHNLAVEEEDC